MTYTCSAPCSSELAPSTEANARLAMEAIYVPPAFRKYRDYIFIGKVPGERYPTACGYWNMFLPDHCCGDNIVFAAASYNDLWECWKPIIIVACAHYEHDDDLDDYRRLSIFAEILMHELFGLIRGEYCTDIWAHWEELVLKLEPKGREYCFRKKEKAIRWIVKHIYKPRPVGIPEWLLSLL